MEANEAQEKIWLGKYTQNLMLSDPNSNTYVEYIRKDTFIEKACEWIKEHKEIIETEDNGIMGWIPDYFIEGFKNYMEGE